jgi:hypothetical protein
MFIPRCIVLYLSSFTFAECLPSVFNYWQESLFLPPARFLIRKSVRGLFELVIFLSPVAFVNLWRLVIILRGSDMNGHPGN